MSDLKTTNEHAEILMVRAENERACGRFGYAEQLDAAAAEIQRLRTALTTTRNLIENDPDNLNMDSITDTIWISPIQAMAQNYVMTRRQAPRVLTDGDFEAGNTREYQDGWKSSRRNTSSH